MPPQSTGLPLSMRAVTSRTVLGWGITGLSAQVTVSSVRDKKEMSRVVSPEESTPPNLTRTVMEGKKREEAFTSPAEN